MRRTLRRFLCMMACAIILLQMCACVPSQEYWSEKENGHYPQTADFPYSKWSCQELNISINMLGNGERTMIGEYTIADTTYRVVAMFGIAKLDFIFYSQTEVSESIYVDQNGCSYIACEQEKAGFLYTEYFYENETLNCTIVNADLPAENVVPKKLTFKKEGQIAQMADSRWRCEEIDMYIESFCDIDGYYKGEIVLEGKICPVQAFEVGNGNLFVFSVENGIINNLKEGTSTELIEMVLELKNGKLVGRITEDICVNPLHYPNWEYNEVTLSFVKESTN